MVEQWRELNSLKKNVASAITTIQHNEFLIVPYCDKDCTAKIFKTNSNLDELKPFINNHPQFESVDRSGKALYNITYNDKYNKIYLIKHDSHELIIIDYETKQFKIFKDNKSISTSYQCLLNTNGQIHLIGGNYNKHFIWNNDTKSFQKIHQFDEFSSLPGLSAVYVHSKQMIILFGWGNYVYSHNSAVKQTHFGIRMFDLKSQKWKVIMDKCPWIQAEAVITSDDKNIIIAAPDSGDIYVLNIENETYNLQKTEIQCPMTGFYHWLRIGDKLKDEMLVDAYIKQLFRMKEFKNIMLPPVYIIKIISKWYQNNEMIHLIEWNVFAEQNEHYSIPIKTILSSIA